LIFISFKGYLKPNNMGLQKLRIIYSLTLIFIIAGTVSAQKNNPKAPWFFIQVTDPQFGMFDSNASFDS